MNQQIAQPPRLAAQVDLHSVRVLGGDGAVRYHPDPDAGTQELAGKTVVRAGPSGTIEATTRFQDVPSDGAVDAQKTGTVRPLVKKAVRLNDPLIRDKWLADLPG